VGNYIVRRYEVQFGSSRRVTEGTVDVAPYDPSWPRRFEEERALLADVLAAWLAGPIEHVGSTAVPGLAAKPVVDIMAGVRSLKASRPAIDAVGAHGYCYFPYRTDSMHWFCKPSPMARTHHLHLVPFGSVLWTERLAFRDYLRAHADVAAEYARLKRELAERYRFDREAYTDAKGPFVERVVAMATGRS
jgi:GrpB-like predicted nucleotidyltransferase (UPF0157 family)